MKIAILGTRGIPNNYGGFERAAENLSVIWVKSGHEVTVYNPDGHPYEGDEWEGVKIKRVFSRESKLGVWGTFIYDYLCLKDAVKDSYDIILELGYVPGAFFLDIKRKAKSVVITNVDGLEWRRKKWNMLLQKFAKYCERKAVRFSDYIVADNLGIRRYYAEHYKKEAFYIPYGVEVFDEPLEEVLKNFKVEKFMYYIVVARIEPENNLDMVLEGFLSSSSTLPIIVVGNHGTKHGKYLLEKYKKFRNIRFVGGIYDRVKLGTLRYFSKIHFHGHSVGGTNPSLLEAMAAGAYIAAHDNEFNRSVLGDDGVYFSSPEDIKEIILNYDENIRKRFARNNLKKVNEVYNWEVVAKQYLELFNRVLKENNG